MRFAFAAALCAATLPASAQPYKCTVDGKVIYQQARCVGGVTVDTSAAGNANHASPGAIAAYREVDLYKRKQRVADAIANVQVFIGMTAAEVRLSWGHPASINRTITASTVSEQWVYGSGAYAYLTDGTVTAIQATTRSATAAPAKVCQASKRSGRFKSSCLHMIGAACGARQSWSG